MVADTLAWWTLLRGVAMVNALAWLALALWLWRSRHRFPPDAWQQRRWQLLLSAGYVLGCGWRSFLPVYDVPRLVLVDSFWSSVIVGRSVATVAELCFAAQWALLLREVSRATRCGLGLQISRAVLPLIAVAEMFSWYSVLTTSNIGHVVEEALWGLCALLLVLSLVLVWPRVQPRWQPLLLAWVLAGVVYVVYMFAVDVPMYWSRWLADEATGRPYLTVMQGLADTAQRWVVSHRWDHWQSEVLWMTSYFSLAVWLSMALVVAPSTGYNTLSAPSTGQRRPIPRIRGVAQRRRARGPSRC
jgi:hypothetical protein